MVTAFLPRKSQDLSHLWIHTLAYRLRAEHIKSQWTGGKLSTLIIREGSRWLLEKSPGFNKPGFFLTYPVTPVSECSIRKNQQRQGDPHPTMCSIPTMCPCISTFDPPNNVWHKNYLKSCSFPLFLQLVNTAGPFLTFQNSAKICIPRDLCPDCQNSVALHCSL